MNVAKTGSHVLLWSVFVAAAMGAISAAPAPPMDYVFVSMPGLPAAYEWSWMVNFGTLDETGRFHLAEKVEHLDQFDTDKPRCSVIVFAKPVRLYEFRSGRLIMGTMMPDGEFIPEAGSKVLKLEDYHYGEDRTIWNLPGYFIRRDKVEARVKWLDEHMEIKPDAFGKEKAALQAAMERKK